MPSAGWPNPPNSAYENAPLRALRTASAHRALLPGGDGQAVRKGLPDHRQNASLSPPTGQRTRRVRQGAHLTQPCIERRDRQNDARPRSALLFAALHRLEIDSKHTTALKVHRAAGLEIFQTVAYCDVPEFYVFAAVSERRVGHVDLCRALQFCFSFSEPKSPAPDLRGGKQWVRSELPEHR